jgi:hypothetical protein
MLYLHALGGCNERRGGARFLGRIKDCATSSHTKNELDIILEVVAAARQRKTKGRVVKGMSERVSKILGHRAVK